MSTELGKLIDIHLKFSFQMNQPSICATMMAAFHLEAMPVNAAFQSALSNDIAAVYPELCYRVRFRINNEPIFFEMRVISTATGRSVKSYSPMPLP